MIEFVPYEPRHLAQIDLQPAQAEWRERAMTREYAESLALPGLAWTGLDGERVAGCAGLAPVWPGRAIAWALFGTIARRDWPRVVGKVRAVFRDAHAAGFHRIETTVQDGFGAGCRLAAAVGLEVEGKLKAYTPDRVAHFIYAKVAA